MSSIFKYKSYPFNIFNTWKIVFFGFLMTSIILCIGQAELIYYVFFGIGSTLIASLYILQTRSIVSNNNNDLLLKDYYKSIHLNDLVEIETWWTYDYGISSIEYIGQGTEGKSQAHANKINCYVKFIGQNDTAYIYEQIYMSDKFPNNHEYKPNVQIDKQKLIKVWGIDNCLKKLNLQVGNNNLN